MKAILALMLAASTLSNSGLLGGFTVQKECSSSLIGSPVNLFTAEINNIHDFFKDNNNKLQLMHFATQVVAGLNYRAVFKMTINDQSQWVGVLAFRGLDGKLTITSFVQTYDLADVWAVLKVAPIDESQLSALDCTNLFEDFGKEESSVLGSNKAGNDSVNSSGKGSNNEHELKKDEKNDHFETNGFHKIDLETITNEHDKIEGWYQSKLSQGRKEGRTRRKGKTYSGSRVGGFKGQSSQFAGTTGFDSNDANWKTINVGSTFEQE